MRLNLLAKAQLPFYQGWLLVFLWWPGRVQEQAIGEIAWLILHNVLGEEDYARYVGHVSVSDVTHQYYDVSKPITELPAEFDAAFKN